MKKHLLCIVFGLSFILIAFNANSQEWKMLDESKSSIESEVKLLNSNESHITLKVEFNAYALSKLSTSKGTANLLQIPDCERTKVKGAPDLPKITQSVVIPDHTDMKVNLSKSKYVELDGIDIVPSKGVLSREIDPSTVPYEYGEVYSKDVFYPSDIVKGNDPYIIRNVRGKSVTVYPVQYNPVTKKVRIYTRLVIDMVPSGTKGVNALQKNANVKNDDVFENVLSNHFLNYKPSTSKLSENTKKMLIVSYSSFMSAMEEFKAWKESIGYTVDLINYSDIGSSSALKNYVQNQYDQNGTGYLLLVGDHAQVPSSSTSAGYSDNNYGYTSGSDHYLDIFVGRFSAENSTQLQTQIDRTIYYESQVNSSDTWFKNGVGIASNEGTGGGGDDNESDEQHMNNIEYDLEGYGYTMDRIYQDGGSASQLSSALNNGRGIINYVGHGSNTSWSSMYYSQTDVNNLSNDHKLPFVISVACVVGNFTGMTCFSETWLRATNNGQPTGAVAFCGSTINQSWASPMCAQDKMNDLLVANSYINYGGMFVNGMFQMIDEYGSDGENMADTWTVFGDPSVQMRTPGHPEGPEGESPNPPVADFTASTTIVSEGESVSFTSTSINNPSEYYWEFEGGTPSTSNSSSPAVTYNTIGSFDVTLTVSNSAGQDAETKYNYITVEEYVPSYCSSAGQDYSYEWIAGVEVGSFSNSSSAAGYTDFTSKTVELQAGNDYAVSLTPGFASSTYNEYWKIWIDYNNDKEFTSDELAFDAGALSKTSVTGTMTIPSGVGQVTTRMRVSMKYNAAQTACESFDYGEVEDYTVIITEPGDDTQAPTEPVNLSASNITETSFTLSWNASTDNIGVVGYDVYQDGSIVSTVTETSANISGLTAGTTFSYYVKAKDAAGNVSAASSTLQVTTDEPADTEAPTAPSNLSSSNTTENSVALSWTSSTDNVGVTGYDIYRNGSYLANTSSTSYTVTGLSASTSYEFYVKAKDAAGNVSVASNTISVTTDDVVAEYCESKGNNSSYEWIAEVTIGTYSNSSGASGYTDFTSEMITLEAGSSVNISLAPGFGGSTYNEYWKIWIDYNGDKEFTSDELVFDAGSLSKTTVNGTINVPLSANGTTRLRVSMKYNGAQTACETFSYGEVEDYTVSFEESVPDTEAPTAPTGLTSSNITNSSFTLSWNASSDNVGVTVYDIYQNDAYYTSSSGTSYIVTGLSAATTYSCYVKAKDAAGNVSAASSTLNVTTVDEQLTYCTSKGNNSSYEWIDLVELNEMSNATGNNGGYADFTNLTATVSRSAEQTIYVSCGFSGSSYTEYWHVWIDWDHSGTFDADERMVYGSSSSADKLSATFTVPSDAQLGSTRMRITMKYNAAATACETFSYGEVEDYTINVTDAGSYAVNAREEAEILGFEAPTTVVLYPVPASDYLNVSIENGTRVGKVSIYNATGSLMKIEEIQGNHKEIDISELPAGSYIISVEDEKEPITKQFVKQ